MKVKMLILGGLGIVGAGIWYLFLRDQQFYKTEEGADPVGPIKRDDSYSNHIRQVTHKAKEQLPQTDLQRDLYTKTI